jgi:prolyl-tRNA synthetase
MRVSNLFTKTSKTIPADEVSKNAQLLIRAGYVYKVMAGVYAYLPLGLRVLEKFKQIVREEMDAIGGQELIMSSLQRKETWEETGRWDDEVVDVWFKSQLKDGTDVGFGWSHEEAIIEMVKQYLESYKDLPINVYQFQTKLRNELRAKSGIMRGREFVMKDMYSCSVDQKQHDKFYQDTIDAYNRVFDRLGIGKDTYVTFASGGAFTQFSHEFQTICDAGEDVIYLHRGKNIAINGEVMDEDNLAKLGI